MTKINVPTRESVSSDNQAIFDNLKKGIGFVPNLYATLAHSDSALGDYLAFNNRKSSLSAKEKEVIHLSVSQINGCTYCQAAHTALAKMNGFSDDQIIEIRSGTAAFNSKLDALTRFSQEVAQRKGDVSDKTLTSFFEAGYSNENLIDVVLIIGTKTIANYLHKIVKYSIDFPVAPKLETESVVS